MKSIKDPKSGCPVSVDMSDISPQMQIGEVKFDEAYCKAFLKDEPKADNEFCQNTTVRD